MPDNPVVWIIAILALAVVVIVALWKGQVVEVDLKPPRLRFKRQGERGGAGTISVGSGMTIENSTTGDIAGVKTAGTGGPGGGQGTISVARRARIAGATTGDIAGVKHSGRSDEETEC